MLPAGSRGWPGCRELIAACRLWGKHFLRISPAGSPPPPRLLAERPCRWLNAGFVCSSPAFVCTPWRASCLRARRESTCVLNASRHVASSLLWHRNEHSSGRESKLVMLFFFFPWGAESDQCPDMGNGRWQGINCPVLERAGWCDGDVCPSELAPAWHGARCCGSGGVAEQSSPTRDSFQPSWANAFPGQSLEPPCPC